MAKSKKRFILKGFVALFVLLFIAVFSISMIYESMVKSSLETVASKILLTDVRIGHLSISPLLGEAQAIDIRIKNPDGFSDDFIIALPSLSASIDTKTLFEDEIVIKEIRADHMNILFEIGQKGTNLQRLQSNIKTSQKTSASATKAQGEKAQQNTKTVVIENLRINGSTLRASLAGQEALKTPLKDIHLKNIGRGSNVSTTQALEIVFGSILQSAIQASTNLSLKSGAEKLLQGTKEIGQSIKSLFE